MRIGLRHIITFAAGVGLRFYMITITTAVTAATILYWFACYCTVGILAVNLNWRTV